MIHSEYEIPNSDGAGSDMYIVMVSSHKSIWKIETKGIGFGRLFTMSVDENRDHIGYGNGHYHACSQGVASHGYPTGLILKC